MHIGLFFGSFNPIHVGHLMIANYMVESTDLQQVWFVVSPQNPLKKKETLLNEYDRLHLVRLAIEDNPKLRASDIEFHLPQPSYTIDTLVHLRERFPQHEFSLIMGADNFRSLNKWKNADVIQRDYRLYIYERDSAESTVQQSTLSNQHFVKAPLLNISATFIREQLKAGVSMRYFLPEKVWEYVSANRLYNR